MKILVCLLSTVLMGITTPVFAEPASDQKCMLTKPASLLNPARIKVKLDMRGDQIHHLANTLVDLATRDELLDLGVNTPYVEVESKDEEKVRLTFFRNSMGENFKAIVVKMKVKKGKLVVYSYVAYKHTNHLYEKNPNRGEIGKIKFRKKLKSPLREMLNLAINGL